MFSLGIDVPKDSSDGFNDAFQVGVVLAEVVEVLPGIEVTVTASSIGWPIREGFPPLCDPYRLW